MKVQTLISTMNQADIYPLVSKMNVSNAIIVNQLTQDIPVGQLPAKNDLVHVVMNETGLSKSRNEAMSHSTAKICLIADDDMEYVADYSDIVTGAYEKYQAADLIIFYVEGESNGPVRNKLKLGRLRLFETMKVTSVQISFKKESILRAGIKFDERYGANARYSMGEENIFLAKCIRSGLRVYSYPEKIAQLSPSKSTWFKGYDEQYVFDKGAMFYAFDRILYPVLIVQYIIRKRRLFIHKSLLQNILTAFKGAKDARETKRV